MLYSRLGSGGRWTSLAYWMRYVSSMWWDTVAVPPPPPPPPKKKKKKKYLTSKIVAFQAIHTSYWWDCYINLYINAIWITCNWLWNFDQKYSDALEIGQADCGPRDAAGNAAAGFQMTLGKVRPRRGWLELWSGSWGLAICPCLLPVRAEQLGIRCFQHGCQRLHCRISHCTIRWRTKAYY